MTLNSDNGINSLTNRLLTQLTDILIALKTDSNVKTLILRSAITGIFCAGADLKERATMTDTEVRETVRRIRSVAEEIYEFPVPTIAAIDGAAVGGGLEYALAADLRVATSDAKMGLVETRLATIPGAGGTQLLSRLIPTHLAKELIFTARMMSGAEAHSYGLLNHCVQQNSEGDQAFRKALELAEAVVRNGPLAIRMSKIAINKGTEVDLKTGLAIESICYQTIIGSKDRIEGLKAFIEKRSPSYTSQ